ncbi:putative DNA mismatch repair protein [Methanocella paludicola SANAE]|uniref:DNA mismatch repair protein n=1 Tax=Methanocella paludicola (strain DSM 17711 / JCM 13418 / NBRC 101707 / SANAE) TaxID=304371 RepID=D1Z1H8_METPS|nr:DNA mismatch repair protein MutS [Methanocella paludicola]BAI62550.1 putative DNA mismatch repair protein [Methanocella paludicola SANAE]
MTFHSILSERADIAIEKPGMPSFFVDLNLDQVIDAITSGKQDYDLKPFFYSALADIGSIVYRQEIFEDLENLDLLNSVDTFADNMCTMRDHLAQAKKLSYRYQKESWFLDAVIVYCHAVKELTRELSRIDLRSRGFCSFRDFLTVYSRSDRFTSLLEEAKQIMAELSTIKYSMIIKDGTIKVRNYESESDYSADVEQTFEKFKQGAVKDYRSNLPEYVEMNHVEAKVLEFIGLLNPETFTRLNDYYAKNQDYLDKTISGFDREVQFYISYIDHIGKFSDIGLQFCYPQISNPGKDVYSHEGFDLALANRLIDKKSPIICNDFYLEGKERIIVVSGPNQGGKTTFARTFGQLHYLASLGCPVPGREARLFICDRIFTHFEKSENIKDLRGKLQDDLVRVIEILNKATPGSIIILNEIFTSTTLSDAVFLSKKVMEKIEALDSLCVCVTFIDELSAFSEKTVSMVSMVVPENPTLRTFKVIRKPADGLSYAISISEKYRLTYKFLKERLDHESVSHAQRP